MLVTTAWLAEHLDDPRLVLIDMSEPVAYERAHIRGAVGVPHPWLKGRENNLEVMPAEEFQALARRLGVSDSSVVILYDDHLNRAAARGWWALERYGFEGARIVDGGLHAWIAEGRPVTQEVRMPAPGTFTARPVDDVTCSLQDLRDAMHPAAGVQIWDVRADNEWEGRNTNNKRAGHIPGAIHFEWRNFVDNTPSHHLVPLADARRMLEAAGINPEAVTVTY
jgi:thiosulfate/3-mercaptopyruvate sulfurtransferase